MRRFCLCLLMMIFALVSIGGDGCSIPWPGGSSSPASSLPYCYTDPPYGCAALCVTANTLGFTDACSGPGSGPLTLKFKQVALQQFQISNNQGIQLCTGDNDCTGATPCAAGINPQVLDGQNHEYCQDPPPGCPLPPQPGWPLQPGGGGGPQ